MPNNNRWSGKISLSRIDFHCTQIPIDGRACVNIFSLFMKCGDYKQNRVIWKATNGAWIIAMLEIIHKSGGGGFRENKPWDMMDEARECA